MEDQEQHQQQQQYYGDGGGNMTSSDLRHLFFPSDSVPYMQPATHHSLFSTTTAGTAVANTAGGGRGTVSGDEVGMARWLRQETLTLLEVRSQLHHKFNEANHKGPLWDEVSRIMSEEHGYHRSGKKCRDKFENLYKYYKKTKDGKSGRQDGNHYRFFRQLEALCGEEAKENEGASMDMDMMMLLRNRKRRAKRSWKSKIKDLIDLKMRKIIERQEVWLEKMISTLEYKEKERMLREEEWRNHEAEMMERVLKLRDEERAWIEARDKALMDALHKLTDKEIATRMASLGYAGSATMCKEKWNFISKDCHKKGKENWRIASIDYSNNSHHQHLESRENNHHYSYGEVNGRGGMALLPQEKGLGGGGGNTMTDSFRFLLG